MRDAAAVTLEVGYTARALQDLNELTIWISDKAGEDIADAYAERVRKGCARIGSLPQIGTIRPEAGRGVRSIPFERSATIFFRVDARQVAILRIIRAGRRTPRFRRG